MAALHGPNGPEIAAKVLELAIDGMPPLTAENYPKVAAALESLFDALMGDTHEAIHDLALLAHLDGITKPGSSSLTSRDFLSAVHAREVIRNRIRERAAKVMRESETGQALAKRLHLDLDPKEPSE